MSFCPKCGKEILDESLGCPICGVRDNTSPSPNTQKVSLQKSEQNADDFTMQDAKTSHQQFEGKQQTNGSNQGTWQSHDTTQSHSQYQDHTTYQQTEQVIPSAMKVLIIVLILLVGGIGWIAGLIAGIILMKSPIEDYRKFGKVITILSGCLLGIVLLCCVLNGVLGLVAFPFITESSLQPI